MTVFITIRNIVEIDGIFFESLKYEYLTKIVNPPDNDPDYVMEQEFDTEKSDSNPVELTRKRKRGRPSEGGLISENFPL